MHGNDKGIISIICPFHRSTYICKMKKACGLALLLLTGSQTRFGCIYNGTAASPVFKDIYAPLDGFVVNGGIKVNL